MEDDMEMMEDDLEIMEDILEVMEDDLESMEDDQKCQVGQIKNLLGQLCTDPVLVWKLESFQLQSLLVACCSQTDPPQSSPMFLPTVPGLSCHLYYTQ
jgi:hypothetical protein